MANEVKVVVNRSAKIAGVTIGGVQESILCDYQQVYQQTIPAGTSNFEVDMPITVANVKVSSIHTDGDSVTLYTNALSTATNPAPSQTIALQKNTPLIYTANEPASTPHLTVNVVKFYITNAGTDPALVQIGVAGQQAPTGGA